MHPTADTASSRDRRKPATLTPPTAVETATAFPHASDLLDASSEADDGTFLAAAQIPHTFEGERRHDHHE